jgi:hypothetical protein
MHRQILFTRRSSSGHPPSTIGIIFLAAVVTLDLSIACLGPSFVRHGYICFIYSVLHIWAGSVTAQPESIRLTLNSRCPD